MAMYVSSHAASSFMEEDITDASGIVEIMQKLSRASHDLSTTEAILVHGISRRIWDSETCCRGTDVADAVQEFMVQAAGKATAFCNSC